MPLHIKPSDQAQIQGTPIFDPVGTNLYIKNGLNQLGWRLLKIPTLYEFFGKDIDLGKAGVILENQFSNYPFLLNNTARTEFFFKTKTQLAGESVRLLVIITKSVIFPASNSTLYYEQAIKQLSALDQINLFSVPIRLIGLFEQINTTVPAVWTVYGKRTSRTVGIQQSCQCQITGKLKKSRCVLHRL